MAALKLLAFSAIGAMAAIDCVPGTYWHTRGSVDCGSAQGCPATGGTAAECCCACHANYYCPGGKKDQPEDACPAGTTSPPGSTSASACTGGGPPGPPGPPAGGCSPQQVFLNYADTPAQMRVSWATACKAGAKVAYGASADALTQTATGAAPKTYSFGSYTSPYLYHVTLDGLAPGARVYYQVGDSASNVSAVFSFLAHPGAGLVAGGAAAYTMAVIGDLGQTANSESTVAHVQAGASRMVMHVGDLSYADSDEPRWDSWGALVEPLAATTPYMVQVGNHEVESKSFVAYAARFAMPAPAAGVDTVWYSHDVAGVHWITLSNYHDFSYNSPQTQWLKADLAAIDRKKTPWVFMQTHAPWYNTNSAHQGDGEAQRLVVEKMIYDAQVDMVFSGHVHAYERSHRAYNNKRDAGGPVYITIGDGGNREGLASKWLAQTPISALRDATYGHGEIVIYNATTIGWEWHENPDAESKVADSIFVTKGVDV